MKVLIIGGGAVAVMFHIPAAIELLGADQVYVAEFSEVQRKKLESSFPKIHILKEYTEKLLFVDFVIIATPPHTHVPIMQACVVNNIPFLCEKPLSLSSGHLKEIIEACEKRKIIAGVCHTYRFLPNRIELRKLLKEMFFGDTPKIEILEGDPAGWPSVSGYNFRKELVPGGVLLDAGVHSLDYIMWCLDEPSSIEYADDSLGGLESNVRMTFTFSSSASAFFRLSRTCSLPNTIKVTGNGNIVEMGIFDFTILHINQKLISVLEKYPDEATDWSNIAKIQLNDFIKSIHNQQPPRCSLQEGLRVIELIETSYSLKRERPLPKELPLPGLTF